MKRAPSNTNIPTEPRKTTSSTYTYNKSPVTRLTMGVTAPMGKLFIPGQEVPYINEEKLRQQNEVIRIEQDRINNEYLEKNRTLSPFVDKEGNRYGWEKSPRQTYSPYTYSPSMNDYEENNLSFGGKKHKKKLIIINDKKKRKSIKKKRKTKRKSLNKRRKTSRK